MTDPTLIRVREAAAGSDRRDALDEAGIGAGSIDGTED
jgi:hypothetical protein